MHTGQFCCSPSKGKRASDHSSLLIPLLPEARHNHTRDYLGKAKKSNPRDTVALSETAHVFSRVKPTSHTHKKSLLFCVERGKVMARVEKAIRWPMGKAGAGVTWELCYNAGDLSGFFCSLKQDLFSSLCKVLQKKILP